MADTVISALSAASALDGTELYPASQGGNSRKVTGAQIQTLMRAAGSATAGTWPILGSGTVLTAPVAGAEEYDGTVRYFTPAASSRAVDLCEYYMVLASPYTLGNNTNTQAAFNSTAGGTLTLPAGVYFFEAMLSLSSMATGSNNAGFDIKGGGNATLTNVLYMVEGIDGATATAATQTGCCSIQSASAAAMVSTVSNATMQAAIRGTFNVSGAGTIIPSIKLASAAAAVVATGSYFRCRCMGGTAVTCCGNWS